MANVEQYKKALLEAHGAGDTQAANLFASKIKELQTQPETTIGEDIAGGLETAATMASGIVAEPLAGIAGIAQSLNPFAEEGAGAQAVEATRKALTYQGGDVSQQQLGAIGEALAPVGEALSATETTLGEAALDLTGSPFVASIAHSLPTAALEILGFKGSKALTKAKGAPTDKQVKKAIVESAPETEAIKNASRSIYKEIDDSGVRVKPNSINKLVSRIDIQTRKKGLDPRTTRKAAGALSALKEMRGGEQPIGELLVQKELAQRVASSPDSGEAMLGRLMVDEIDDFIDTLDQKDLARGNADIGKKVKAAGKLWGRAKRSEEITGAIKAAELANSGMENGLRIEFAKILRSKKRSKYFPKNELDAMQDLVNGDTKTNLAKLIGRLGFSEGRATNVLTSLGGVYGGSELFGTAGAIAVPAIGFAAKQLAQKITKNKSAFVDKIARAGTDANRITKAYLTSVPKAKRNPNDLADLLMDPLIDLDELDMIANKTMQDAVDIAKGKRAINLAAGAMTGEANQLTNQEQSTQQ